MGINRVGKNKIEIRTPINNIDVIIGEQNDVYYYKRLGGKLRKCDAEKGYIFLNHAKKNTESNEHLYNVLLDGLYKYNIGLDDGYMETLIALGIIYEKEIWGKGVVMNKI